MITIKKGFLITIEGIDGSGKSSLVKNLSTLFIQKNFRVVTTKEPGGTDIGKVLRGILHTKNAKLCPLGQYLLFAADRAEHFESVVLPALKNNAIVISDRMSDSSLAYQCFGNNLSFEMVNQVNRWTMQYKDPDIVFYITIDLQTALNRIQERNQEITFFEKKEFLEKVNDGFKTIFADRNNVCKLNGNESESNLAMTAYNYCLQWIEQQQYPAKPL